MIHITKALTIGYRGFFNTLIATVLIVFATILLVITSIGVPLFLALAQVENTPLLIATQLLGVIVALLIYLFPLGYLGRVIQTSSNGSMSLPSWQPFFQLFTRGFKLALVTLIYGIPYYLLRVIPYTSSIDLRFVLTLIYSGLFVFFIPALFTVVSQQNTIRSGFSKSHLWAAISTGNYIIALLTSVLIFVAYYIVTYAIGVGLASLISPSLVADSMQTPQVLFTIYYIIFAFLISAGVFSSVALFGQAATTNDAAIQRQQASDGKRKIKGDKR